MASGVALTISSSFQYFVIILYLAHLLFVYHLSCLIVDEL